MKLNTHKVMTIAVLWFWQYLHVKLENQATWYLCLTELRSALLCRVLNRNWADAEREREREMCVCARWTETEQTRRERERERERERDVCARALNRNWADSERERGRCVCAHGEQKLSRRGERERERYVRVLGKQDFALARQYQWFSETK